MKVSLSLAICLSFLVSRVSAEAATSLYSFKCSSGFSSNVYYCPGLTVAQICTSSDSTPTVLSDKDCSDLIKSSNKDKPFNEKCPDKGSLVEFTTYDCKGTNGWTTTVSGSSSCKCSGKCGTGTCSGGSTSGDPHFRTHDGTQYDFHGECDLVMARSRSLISGFDLDVHARSKDMGGWSLIESAAVKIGDDILEVQNDGAHYLNGVSDVEFPFFMAGHHKVIKAIEHLDSDSSDPEEVYRTWYIIDIHGEFHKIEIMRFKNMLSIQVDAELHDTAGMLGTPSKDGMVGRDQQTIFEDPDMMGMEWQVRDTEPMLFREIRAPQFPEGCAIPHASARRLRHSERSLREASEACTNVDGAMLRNCIEDILLTGNKYVAHAYIGLGERPF